MRIDFKRWFRKRIKQVELAPVLPVPCAPAWTRAITLPERRPDIPQAMLISRMLDHAAAEQAGADTFKYSAGNPNEAGR